jgi:hypothetical protein
MRVCTVTIAVQEIMFGIGIFLHVRRMPTKSEPKWSLCHSSPVLKFQITRRCTNGFATC